MQNNDKLIRVVRPMPWTLLARGIVAENDFEHFCDKVDALFDKRDAKSSVLITRYNRSSAVMLLLTIIAIQMTFLIPGLLAELLWFSTILCGLIMFVTFCAEHCCESSNLQNDICQECAEMSNCTALATFELVLTVPVVRGSRSKISHIDVIISDTDEQL